MQRAGSLDCEKGRGDPVVITYVHRTMIVPASLAPLARALAVSLEPVAAAGMWETGLSPTGEAPATQYVSAGMIEDVFAALVVDAQAMHRACVAAGARATLEQCQQLVALSDVSDEPAFDAFSRLGLILASPEPAE